MMRSILLLLAPLCFLFYGCPGGECVDNPLLSYQGSFNIKPEKSVYQLGDTLIFNSTIAIKDLFSEAEPEKYEVASKISVARIDTADNYPSKNFSSYIVVGSQYPLTHRDSVDLLDTNLANFIFGKKQDSLLIVIEAILRHKGVFNVGMGTAGLKIFGNKKCEQFSIFQIYYDGDNNYEIFQTYNPNVPENQLGYYFRVE